MKVEFSSFVEGDLETIADYIARDNPRRALTFILEIYDEIQAIGRSPLHYRLRPELGFDARLARVGRYVILFRISGKTVRVERVVYGGRPPILVFAGTVTSRSPVPRPVPYTLEFTYGAFTDSSSAWRRVGDSG